MINDKLKKTPICNMVALEVIDFAKKTEVEQADIKKLLDGFINQAVLDIPQEDRLIADTNGGATIICSGALEDALEDALFISITIRDEILKHNALNATPLYVQFGIHLGAARMLKKGVDGEGVDEARRIMSFANPNQILVSNVYFEMASKLTQEMAQMFDKYEMHAHDHDIYAVRLLKEAVTEESPTIPTDIAEPEEDAVQTIVSKINWNYIGMGCLALAAFFVLGKLVSSPTEPTIILEQPAVAEVPEKPDTEPVAAVKPAAEIKQVENKTIENEAVNEEPKKVKVVRKQLQKKVVIKTEPPANQPEKSAESKVEKAAEPKPEKTATGEKSGWQTVKESVSNGTQRKCSQAEIAMNQCNR